MDIIRCSLKKDFDEKVCAFQIIILILSTNTRYKSNRNKQGIKDKNIIKQYETQNSFQP